ncbi:MAG: flagellar basal body-associated FliL family protein [Anaerolineaceae bacterium]|nr:flagellar basal body-associated FliL family protein [Anaerolineaceae bacterium]
MGVENGTESKPTRSIFRILKQVGRILLMVLFAFTALSNLILVYIVFAPDSLPKPFYLRYGLTGQTSYEEAEMAHTETGNEEGNGNGTDLVYPEGEDTPTIRWENIPPGQGVSLDTGTKIVNLADPGGRKFVRTNIVLEFAPNDARYYTEWAHPEEVAVEEEDGGHGGGETVAGPSEKEVYLAEFQLELDSRLVVINDILITLLSTKEFQDVYTAEGKEVLRTEIIETINEKLPDYHIIYVYFTEFVVQ